MSDANKINKIPNSTQYDTYGRRFVDNLVRVFIFLNNPLNLTKYIHNIKQYLLRKITHVRLYSKYCPQSNWLEEQAKVSLKQFLSNHMFVFRCCY